MIFKHLLFEILQLYFQPMAHKIICRYSCVMSINELKNEVKTKMNYLIELKQKPLDDELINLDNV